MQELAPKLVIESQANEIEVPGAAMGEVVLRIVDRVATPLEEPMAADSTGSKPEDKDSTFFSPDLRIAA